ncbi:MAG: phosphate ABC transporter permease subunit PstC [Actinobacteria bacterium]|nr:phosphate ABC transporter permease subunit PstC [Actinomycetota bacterium]
MTQVLDPPASGAAPEPPPPLVGGPRPPGYLADRTFRIVAVLAGVMVLVILALIIWVLFDNSLEWFREEGIGSVFSLDWAPNEGKYGAGALVIMTLMVAVIALLLAVPVSVGIALFINEIAPRRARLPIVFVVDLLAAIPSVVFGLWVLRQLASPLADIYADVHNLVKDVPILGDVFGDPSASGLAIMTAGIVVGIMIMPIVTAITREVFATTPASQKEATLAMGATRWEMIRGAIFPHSRSGVVAAVIIGFGRAVGETIAVALVIGSSQVLTENVFAPGDTLASIIANQFGEASGVQRSALIGFGLVLLAMTIVLGIIARSILRRANRRLGIA